MIQMGIDPGALCVSVNGTGTGYAMVDRPPIRKGHAGIREWCRFGRHCRQFARRSIQLLPLTRGCADLGWTPASTAL